MNAASVKDKLKNISDRTGRNFQNLLIAYGLERTIYRLSISPYRDNLILKGGILLYALSDGDYPRVTTDIDFLAQRVSNELENIKSVFIDIFSIQADDALEFELSSLVVKHITEFKEYHGVNVSVMAYLDRTRIPISIDIGFGDVIYPDKVLMEFPSLISEEAPKVFAYSLATSIAEKFESIVSLGYDNSRFKDYFDIYVWINKTSFEGTILLEAVKETFEHRGTSPEKIVAFEPGFANDPIRTSRWTAFAKKKKISLDVTLEETIRQIEVFISPIMEAIIDQTEFDKRWDPEKRVWE